MLVAVVCALGSALLYALASVFQQRAAAVAPPDASLKLSLLGRLARNPVWLVGITADMAGYALQFIALDHGSLVLVQPLFVCGLLFALPLGAGMSGERLAATDWVAAVAVCCGLSLFLVVAGRARGHTHPTAAGWAAMLISAAALSAVMLAIARGRPANQRAALMSAAAGIIYGLSAGFTKVAGHLLREGWVHLFLSWQVVALVVTGIVGMVVAQSAFQAGDLEASLPPMTVVDPVVSVLIGAAAFGERLPLGAASVLAELGALVVMAAGVFALARSKVVRAVHGGVPR